MASPTLPHVDLDALMQSLPACKRCRECRRGCDTLLPKCRQCTKANVECSFYDHGKNELLPRSYIARLLDHVNQLRSTSTTNSSDPSPTASGSTPHALDTSIPPAPAAVVNSESATAESLPPDAQPPSTALHHDHYFAVAADSYRYLGSEACLIKSPRQNAKITSPDLNEEDDDDFQLSWRQSNANSFELVEVYLEAVHSLYPILDLSARYLAREPPADLSDPELFNLNMVYSIACHVMPMTSRKRHPGGHIWNPTGRLTYHMGNNYKYRNLAKDFFAKAENYIEAATADTSIDTLRAVLLLAINSLFDPLTGNIGQQIALAARLAFSLKQKAAHEFSAAEAEMLKNMYNTIFSLENEFATVLDRPATFPEPDTPLTFDPTHPHLYLLSLSRLQHRFRQHPTRPTPSALLSSLPLLDAPSLLPPTLRLALHQTHLLLNPIWQTAWYVLEACISMHTLHTCTTPHWVYRAATILTRDMRGINPADVIQLYSNALVVLELSSWKWASAGALSASLSGEMERMKRGVAGVERHWEGTKTLYDVRL